MEWGSRLRMLPLPYLFPESGTYYVYVRTYNWTSPWHDGKGPGKFTLKIGNKKLPIVLGDEGNQWMWQPAGKISVKAGNSNLTLKDLTGFNGRCDAIYFTTEKEQLPPNETVQLTDFRKRCWIFQPNRSNTPMM